MYIFKGDFVLQGLARVVAEDFEHRPANPERGLAEPKCVQGGRGDVHVTHV